MSSALSEQSENHSTSGPEACTYDCEHIETVKGMAWPCQEIGARYCDQKTRHQHLRWQKNNRIHMVSLNASKQLQSCSLRAIPEDFWNECLQRLRKDSIIIINPRTHGPKDMSKTRRVATQMLKSRPVRHFPPGMLYKVSLLSNRVNIENLNFVYCSASFPFLAILRP